MKCLFSDLAFFLILAVHTTETYEICDNFSCKVLIKFLNKLVKKKSSCIQCSLIKDILSGNSETTHTLVQIELQLYLKKTFYMEQTLGLY